MSDTQTLRPYQIEAIEAIKREFFTNGARRVLLHMATGGGKSVIFSYILKNRRVPALMVVKGKALVEQAHQRMMREGVNHGVIMAGHWNSNPSAPVQIASIDTLANRPRVPFEIIIIDEADQALSPKYVKFLAQYPNAYILDITATPYNGLHSDVVVKPVSMMELIQEGYLVPPRYFGCTDIDLKAVRSSGSDYNNVDLAKAMDKGDLIGDIVDHWIKYGEDRPTGCFGINIAHSQHIAEKFRARGIPWEHCDADTPKEKREEILEGVKTSRIKGFSNVNIWARGVDLPWLSCLIMARPTQSYNLYIQQAGRGTRTFENKKDFIILDHASNVKRHGFITDEPEAVLAKDVHKKAKATPSIKQCAGPCYTYYKGAACPVCGGVKAAEIKFEKQGELKEIKSLSEEEEYLIWLKRERRTRVKADGTKYKPGWVYMQFKAKYPDEVKKHFKPRVVPEWVRRNLEGRNA